MVNKMFRIVLISSLFALSLAAPLNVALPTINGLPDFSDILDNVTDAVKAVRFLKKAAQ